MRICVGEIFFVVLLDTLFYVKDLLTLFEIALLALSPYTHYFSRDLKKCGTQSLFQMKMKLNRKNRKGPFFYLSVLKRRRTKLRDWLQETVTPTARGGEIFMSWVTEFRLERGNRLVLYFLFIFGKFDKWNFCNIF